MTTQDKPSATVYRSPVENVVKREGKEGCWINFARGTKPSLTDVDQRSSVLSPRWFFDYGMPLLGFADIQMLPGFLSFLVPRNIWRF
ncbi:hypothetical protein Agabi119p4_2688 [Agaricus bisporus var. burnettii]|uniref:Uncharacterized protein n=1 Tax=Agaricus bisporus var. burnettii TaxID=192524 RepID=A0A8H7F9R4_AGABI|nr:hypothetical protein Agabi119p4_2688 [Agaricus bisporus var. burnettii]